MNSTSHLATQYYDEFVSAGFNQVAAFTTMTDAQLSEIVPLVGHRRKVLLAQEKLKGPVSSPFSTPLRLVWFVAFLEQ